MVRRRVIKDIFKSISTIVGFSGTSIAASHIDETNVKEYYSVLQAMGRAGGLRIDSPLEDVSEVWMNNKLLIQRRKSIRFEGESITELPYNALNEMHSLVELSISDNPVFMINPEKFTTLQERLAVINFSFCRMSPEIFNAITNCTCLEKLSFYNTSLKGILDSADYSWGNLERTLIELCISRSDLTIEALDRIAELESLRILDAHGNYLNDLSNWLDFKNLSNLTELNLSWNQLTSIPNSIDNLSNLTELGLSSNGFTSIPESIGDLKNLTKLYLYSNQLTSIPESIGDLKNLTKLYLSYNMLTSVPSTIRNLRNTLHRIDISNTNIISRSDHENSLGIQELKEAFGDKLTTLSKPIQYYVLLRCFVFVTLLFILLVI